MSMLTGTVAFLLGVYLGVRLLAALYRIIDLWYARRREWLRIVRGIAGWGAATVLAAMLFPDPRPLFWGVAAYAAFFVVSYAAMHTIVRMRAGG